MPSARQHKPRVKPAGKAKPARSAPNPARADVEQVSSGSQGEADEHQTRRFEPPHGSAEVREIEGYDESIAPAQADGAGNGETASRRSKRPPEPPR